jgi:hypothetical protein
MGVTGLTATKTCFIVSPIGDEGTAIRKRADQVFRHIIAPVVEARGYKPERADRITRPGVITSQVLQEVADSDLVVADLSTYNPNVFYELAIRHATQKPLVQLISTDEDLPFDIAAMRTIFFDIHDLDSVERARDDLNRHIESLEEDPTPVETPIAAALGIKALRESEDPMEQTVADLAEQVAALRSELARQGRDAVRTTIGASSTAMPSGTILRTASEPLVLTNPPFRANPEGFNFIMPDALGRQAPVGQTAPHPAPSKPQEPPKRSARKPSSSAKKRGDKK